MKKYIITIILLNILINSLFAQKENYLFTKYDTALLKEDFKFIKDAVINGHPGALRYSSKEDLINSYNELSASIIEPMTEKQFRILATKWIAKIKCGHTIISPSKKYLKEVNKKTEKKTKQKKILFLKYKKTYKTIPKPFYMPFDYGILNNELYIKLNRGKDSTILRNTKILSIDKIAVKDILNTMNNFVTSDGYNTTNKDFYIAKAFNRYYAFLFDTNRTKEMHVQLPDGTTKTLNVKCIDTLKVKEEADFKLTYLYDSIALIDLNSFTGRAQRKFYNATFKELNEKNINHLILDLRGNGGGRIKTSNALLSYLLPYKFSVEVLKLKSTEIYQKKVKGKLFLKITGIFLNSFHKEIKLDTTRFFQIKYVQKKYNYKNKLYVITDGGSFSASSIVSAYLKRNNRAVFYGTETGGAENGCNAFNMPQLPVKNTGVSIRYPLYQVNHIIPKYNYGRGIMPDNDIKENLMIEDSKNNIFENWSVDTIIKSINK